MSIARQMMMAAAGAGGGGPDLTQGVVAIAHATVPNVSAYPWDDATGFGTKYANPATLPTGTGRGVAFKALTP